MDQDQVIYQPIFCFGQEIKNRNLQFNNEQSQQIGISQQENQENQKQNPQFEATILRYAGIQDLALHDYQRDDRVISTERFNQNCFVYRYTQQQNVFIEFVPEEQAKYGIVPSHNAQIIMHIKLFQSQIDCNKTFYFIKPQPITLSENKNFSAKKLEKKVFRSIRNQKNQSQIGYTIQKYAQIRFGLQDFKITELQLKFRPQRSRVQVDNLQQKIYLQQQIKQGTCKICLTGQNQVDNPLFEPCKCRGSCRYVHLLCLRTWLNISLVKSMDQKVDTYTWTKFQCQICRSIYPLKLRYKGKLLRLAQFDLPFFPYFVLERLRQGPRKKVFIVKAFNEPITIGRTLHNDIPIALNSISRNHASIQYHSGNFFLRDLHSKFGTLIKIEQDLRIQDRLKVQVGDLVIDFNLVKKEKGKQIVWKYQ